MANIRIAYINLIDRATLTATSEALVVENLQDFNPGVKWRSTGITQQILTADLGGAKTPNFVFFDNHNLTFSTGTIKLQGSTVSNFATIAYDSSALDALDADFEWDAMPDGYVGIGAYTNWRAWEKPFFVHYFTGVSARYWRLVINDSGNSDGYFQAGRWWLGSYLVPTANMEWGFGLDYEDPSEILRARGGGWRSSNKRPYKTANVNFRWLSTAETDLFLDMKQLRGNRGDILISAYPEEASERERRTTIMGVLRDWSANQHVHVGYNTLNFTVEESI